MNARTIGLGLGLLLVAGVAQAQPEVEWERTFDLYYLDRIYSIVSTVDGGYCMTGLYKSAFYPSIDICYMKTDREGEEVFSYSFGGPANDFCRSMVATEDGGFALGGTTNSFGAGNWDIWLTKIDSNGTPVWAEFYGTNGLEVCNSIIKTHDGGYALAGYYQPDGDSTYDVLLIRTDDNGDSLWSTTYGGNGNEACYSILEMEDGGFALAGYTGSFGAYGYDYWLIRTDDSGDSLWSRTYGGEDYELCYSFAQTSDGGFALAGYSTSFGRGAPVYWLVRTNSEGDSLWSRTFGDVDTSICRSILSTGDGGFALAGYSKLRDNDNYDMWLVRTDANGERLWSKSFGRNSSDYCFSTLLTENGGYLLAGSTGSDPDFYLVKTTPDPVSVRDPRSTLNPLTFNLYPAYPNPFNSMVTIPFVSGSAAQPTRLAIFDPLGRRVADLSNSAFRNPNSAFGRVVWDATGMAAGSYFIRLEAGGTLLEQPVILVK